MRIATQARGPCQSSCCSGSMGRGGWAAGSRLRFRPHVQNPGRPLVPQFADRAGPGSRPRNRRRHAQHSLASPRLRHANRGMACLRGVFLARCARVAGGSRGGSKHPHTRQSAPGAILYYFHHCHDQHNHFLLHLLLCYYYYYYYYYY